MFRRRTVLLIAPSIAVLCALSFSAAAQKWVSPPAQPQPSQPQSSKPPPSPQAPASRPQPGARVQATGDYLSRMDADGDGKVSPVEYQDWLSYAFDGMDRNRDGVLSAQEQPGGRGQPLTREAHRTRLAERFRLQDANRDGMLDAKELSAPPRAR
jgi:EF hand